MPIRVSDAREVRDYTVDQRRRPEGPDGFHALASLLLAGPTTVRISNLGTDGYVVVDAVRFVLL